MTRAALPYWSVVLVLLAGAALRLYFILIYPMYDGDSGVYGTIAKNLLIHHAYALDKPYHLTLIRLPGYPFFLALIFKVFGMENYDPARPIQMAIDMASCLLIAGFVRDHASRRAAHWALWLAALCPFTANYTADPMTETNSNLCVALGLFAGGRLIRGIRAQDRLPWGYLALTAAALSCAILFRPDGVLLPVAIVPGIWWYTRSAAPRVSWRAALLCALFAALPFVPWTIRNYRVFHVFQPLAPRSATDPGEDLSGYVHWTKPGWWNMSPPSTCTGKGTTRPSTYTCCPAEPSTPRRMQPDRQADLGLQRHMRRLRWSWMPALPPWRGNGYAAIPSGTTWCCRWPA